MRISIVIPVYNVEEYIEKCLLSCIRQDVPHSEYEIIIVNDGSLDNSLAVVERVSKHYDNIRIINQENKGLSGARNTGISNAKGEYIWFVDSDDWITENCLNKILSKLIYDKPDCLVVGAANVIDNKVYKRDNFNINAKTGVELLKYGVEICAPFAIWKYSFLRDNGLFFYEGIFHEDIEFSSRAYYLTKKISLLNDICYNVFRRPNSITQTPNPKRSFDLINIINVQLSTFVKNVEEEHLIIYHDRIALNINNALNNMIHNSSKYRSMLNLMIYKQRKMFMHLLKSSHFKYKIEGILFYIFPRHTFQVYMFCQLFNSRYKK